MISAAREGESITLSFPFCAENLQKVRQLVSRKYLPDRKVWQVPLYNLYEVIDKINDLELDESLQQIIDLHKIEINVSATADYLYDYQKTGTEFLLKKKRCLLADQMGLGKSVQVIAAIEQSQEPALIVCPKSVKTEWARMVK